jgi:hypothetical protein
MLIRVMRLKHHSLLPSIRFNSLFLVKYLNQKVLFLNFACYDRPMSSFISLRHDTVSLRVGNPTFSILLACIEEAIDTNPALARIWEKNPIADAIGRLNLNDIGLDDIWVFYQLAEGAIEPLRKDPLSIAGFNIYEDLKSFVGQLKQAILLLK